MSLMVCTVHHAPTLQTQTFHLELPRDEIWVNFIALNWIGKHSSILIC